MMVLQAIIDGLSVMARAAVMASRIASVSLSLEGLLKSLGYAAAIFTSAEDFLTSKARAGADCLILDVTMPGMSGPELQRELIAQKQKLPIIFVTAHGDEEVASRVG